MHVTLLPAFSDNYLFAVRCGDGVAAVDPGDAEVIEQHLTASGKSLTAILVTAAGVALAGDGGKTYGKGVAAADTVRVLTALVSAQGEVAQLRQTVAGLRESLELAQIDKVNSVNRERSLFADEGNQLQNTIQALREQIEAMRRATT